MSILCLFAAVAGTSGREALLLPLYLLSFETSTSNCAAALIWAKLQE